MPTLTHIARAGGWLRVVEAAGIEHPGQRFGEPDSRAALIDCGHSFGGLVSKERFDDWVRLEAAAGRPRPSSQTCRRQLARGWPALRAWTAEQLVAVHAPELSSPTERPSTPDHHHGRSR